MSDLRPEAGDAVLLLIEKWRGGEGWLCEVDVSEFCKYFLVAAT